MADPDIDNTPIAENSGPPPSGGGSSNSALGKWNASVLAAFETLNPGIALEGDYVNPELPYRNLSRLDKIHRRQLEELTIANTLFRVKQGRYPSTDKELRGFLAENQSGVREFWQNEINTRGRGVPRIFSGNYTLAEIRDWLADRNLFGISDAPASRSLETEEDEEEEEKKEQKKPEASKKETKPAESKVKPSVYTGVTPPAPSGPEKPAEAQTSPEDIDSEDFSEADAIEDTGIALPAGLAGAEVGVREKLASAARPGKRLQIPPEQLSKRAAKRNRGKQRGKSSGNKGKSAVQSKTSQNVTTGSTEVSTSHANVGAEEETGNVFGQDRVVNKLPRAQINSGGGGEAIPDDSLAPGFAEAERSSGRSGEAAGATSMQEEAADGSLRPGMVEAKKHGPGSARGEFAGGGQGGTEGEEGSGILGASGEAGEMEDSGPAAGSAMGARAGSPRAGKKGKAVAEQEGAGSVGTAGVAQGKPSVASGAQGGSSQPQGGGVQARVPSGTEVGIEASGDSEIPGPPEFLPEAVQENLDEPAEEASNVDGIAPGLGASVARRQDPDSDKLAASQPKTAKKASSEPGEENPLAEEGAPTDSESQEEQMAEGVKAPAKAEQPEVNPAEDEEEGDGDDYMAPQFAPGEYQSPEQAAQAQRQKAAAAKKNRERNQGRDAASEEDEERRGPKISNSLALDRFEGMPTGAQVDSINDWIGKRTFKKKRIPSISNWQMGLLETAALKYPELKELLDEIKTESYKASHGLDELDTKPRKERSRNLEDEFMFWVKKIVAEWAIKWVVSTYILTSAAFDGGIEAILAIIGLHIYWILSLIFKDYGYLQGLTRLYKWLLAGLDIVVGVILMIVGMIMLVGFCQLPGVGAASRAASWASYVWEGADAYAICATVNDGISDLNSSPAGQNLAPVPVPGPGP